MGIITQTQWIVKDTEGGAVASFHSSCHARLAAKIERKLKNLQNAGQSETMEAQKLGMDVRLLRSAEALQPLKAVKMTFAELVSKFEPLLADGQDVPKLHQWIVTRRYCEEQLRAGRVEAWQRAMSLMPPDDQPEWDIGYPAFQPALPAIDLPKELDGFRTYYVDSLFNDAFIRLLMDERLHPEICIVCEAAWGGKREGKTEQIVVMCHIHVHLFVVVSCTEAFLDMYDEWHAWKLVSEMDSDGEESSAKPVPTFHISGVEETAALMAQACRGFVGMLNPCPRHRGATAEDVACVMPPQKMKQKGATLADLGVRAKTVMNVLRDNPTWVQLRKDSSADRGGGNFAGVNFRNHPADTPLTYTSNIERVADKITEQLAFEVMGGVA